MPRIAGIDVPDKKKIFYALQYIHGIGPKFAGAILTEAAVDRELRSIEGALRRQVAQNIQRLKDIRSYRGDRHRRGLPVRGQRTRCNARTRKGRKKTVAGKKGVKAK